MQRSLRPATLVPRGFVVDEVTSDGAGALITVRGVGNASSCPGCGRASERVHSRYRRHLADLPMAGKPVRLVVRARRFHCDTELCGRRIFAERFDDDVLMPWARRTARLDHIVHHLGLALGGRPAASFARRLVLPVSNDTLLRVVRRRGSPNFTPPTVVGIDDWAWRRNQQPGPRRVHERPLVPDPCGRARKVGGLAQILQRGSPARGNRPQAADRVAEPR